jgi:hypothetical protein
LVRAESGNDDSSENPSFAIGGSHGGAGCAGSAAPLVTSPLDLVCAQSASSVKAGGAQAARDLVVLLSRPVDGVMGIAASGLLMGTSLYGARFGLARTSSSRFRIIDA